MPAAWCGAVGLKPTFGRVSRRGAVSCSWTLGHLGPITRSARDAALVLKVIAGPDPLDPYSADAPVEPPAQADAIALGGSEHPLAAVVARTTSVFNLAGNPAVCLPCGRDDRGLPISLQVATPPWREADCLRIAHAYELRTAA